MAIPLLIGAVAVRGYPEESPWRAARDRRAAAADSVVDAAIPQAGHDVYGDPLPERAISRLGTIRLRQTGQGWRRIAFLPDGSQFVVGGLDSDARCWDARTGVMTHKFDLGGAATLAFCVSPTDGAVATLGLRYNRNRRECKLEVVVWNPKTWSQRSRITWKGRPRPQVDGVLSGWKNGCRFGS